MVDVCRHWLITRSIPDEKAAGTAAADTTAPAHPSFPLSGTKATRLSIVCTVYIAMFGSETFYRHFQANIHPAFPHALRYEAVLAGGVECVHFLGRMGEGGADQSHLHREKAVSQSDRSLSSGCARSRVARHGKGLIDWMRAFRCSRHGCDFPVADRCRQYSLDSIGIWLAPRTLE